MTALAPAIFTPPSSVSPSSKPKCAYWLESGGLFELGPEVVGVKGQENTFEARTFLRSSIISASLSESDPDGNVWLCCIDGPFSSSYSSSPTAPLAILLTFPSLQIPSSVFVFCSLRSINSFSRAAKYSSSTFLTSSALVHLEYRDNRSLLRSRNVGPYVKGARICSAQSRWLHMAKQAARASTQLRRHGRP